MQDFYKFAGEHPFLTFFLVAIILQTVIIIVPWRKQSGKDNSDD